ncbi:MAG: portal protein [Podoviridae sp. ctDWo9]|nr:MAG: portal protein [Podoviridae sp. ctDWo9]
MPRISNLELLVRYRQKLEQSRRWRREERYDDLWQRMIDLYRGKHHTHANQSDQLLVNMAFSTINIVAPAVSVNHPKITVNARKPEDGDRAVVTEAILNYWWRHYGCQAEFRRAVKDCLILGHGWVKTGYRYVEEEKAEEYNFDTADELAELRDENIAESNLIVKEDRPFVERVSPFDIFVDPDATSMDDVRWIAQRLRRPLEDVKKDKRYNSTARQEASPSHYSKWGQDSYRPRQSTEKHDAYVEIWEWYDLDRCTVSVFCDGSDRFLVSPKTMPYAFGQPFVMIRNYDVPETFYPMGELEAIEPLQHELNQTRTQMMNHRKRFSRKWLFKETAFDTDGRQALESDEDNVMVPVIADENLGNVIVPMPAVINPPELYNQSDLISNDISRVSGVSEYQHGALPEIRRTATEAAIVQDASNARASDKLAIIERAIGECGKRLVKLAQQFMTGEQAVRIVGSEAQPLWLTFDRDYIKGEFDFEVEAGSTQPMNESFRRQRALQIVDAMAPFAGTGLLDMAKLAVYVLQFGFGIKQAEGFIMPPAPAGMPPGMPAAPEMPQQAEITPGMGAGSEGVPPTGGMPLPSNIPPEILAQLLGSGAPLPNTQVPQDLIM